jgi:excisionase family DNA binding protein
MGCLITLICIIVGGWIIGGISAYRNYKNRPKFPKYDPKPWRKAPWPELNPLCMHCGESACQVTKESQRQVSNPYGPPDVKMFCDVICTSCGKLNTTGNAHTIDPKKRAKWDAIERHHSYSRRRSFYSCVLTRPDNHPITLLQSFYPGALLDPLPEKEMPQEKPVGAFQVVVQPVITIFQAPPGKAEVYDLQAAAAYLGITPRKLRELFAAKRVRGTRIDYRHYAFTQSDLDEYLSAYRQQPKRLRS